jgi:hypothetical protein
VRKECPSSSSSSSGGSSSGSGSNSNPSKSRPSKLAKLVSQSALKVINSALDTITNRPSSRSVSNLLIATPTASHIETKNFDQLDSQTSHSQTVHAAAPTTQESIKYHELLANKPLSTVYSKRPAMGLTARMIKCMRSSSDYDAIFAASLCSQPDLYLNYLPALFSTANFNSFNSSSISTQLSQPPPIQYNFYDRLSRSQFASTQQSLATPNKLDKNPQSRATPSTCRFSVYNSFTRSNAAAATTVYKPKQTQSPQYDSIIDTVF